MKTPFSRSCDTADEIAIRRPAAVDNAAANAPSVSTGLVLPVQSAPVMQIRKYGSNSVEAGELATYTIEYFSGTPLPGLATGSTVPLEASESAASRGISPEQARRVDQLMAAGVVRWK